MNFKTTKAIYWIGVILTSLWFGTSGIYNELKVNRLGYNSTTGIISHFIYILGVAKVLGIIVLLANRLLELKEWSICRHIF